MQNYGFEWLIQQLQPSPDQTHTDPPFRVGPNDMGNTIACGKLAQILMWLGISRNQNPK